MHSLKVLHCIRQLEAERNEAETANKKLKTDVQSLQKTLEMFQLIHQGTLIGRLCILHYGLIIVS